MDDDIQASLVEEDIEIKEEPIEDHEYYNREEKCGVLGNFYQVECNAGPEECMLEGEEDEVLQKNMNGCACSQVLERLESRMGRLECLLELVVSKVVSSGDASSPPPAHTSQSPTASEVDWCSTSSSNGSSKATTPLHFVKLDENPRSHILPEQIVEHTERNDHASFQKEQSNLSPLVKAAEIGDLSGLELILKNQPPIKQVGEALLRTGSPSVVKLLSQVCPDVIQRPEGSKALLLAAEWGRVALLHALLDAGVQPNSTNRNTMTGLHKAATKGHANCVRALLERGADVSVTTSCKWSALHMAAMSGTTDCMSALVKAGADIEAQDKYGCTPLHYAARWNQVNAVEWLLQKGACQYTKNHRGKTPLDLTNGEEILKLLTRQSKTEDPEDLTKVKPWLSS